jgi:hypothetical protein
MPENGAPRSSHNIMRIESSSTDLVTPGRLQQFALPSNAWESLGSVFLGVSAQKFVEPVVVRPSYVDADVGRSDFLLDVEDAARCDEDALSAGILRELDVVDAHRQHHINIVAARRLRERLEAASVPSLPWFRTNRALSPPSPLAPMKLPSSPARPRRFRDATQITASNRVSADLFPFCGARSRRACPFAATSPARSVVPMRGRLHLRKSRNSSGVCATLAAQKSPYPTQSAGRRRNVSRQWSRPL